MNHNVFNSSTDKQRNTKYTNSNNSISIKYNSIYQNNNKKQKNKRVKNKFYFVYIIDYVNRYRNINVYGSCAHPRTRAFHNCQKKLSQSLRIWYWYPTKSL